jgi:hypothetical protein
MTIDGAAGYLAVSPWTIRALLDGGALRRVRLALPGQRELRRVLLDVHDLDSFIEACRD